MEWAEAHERLGRWPEQWYGQRPVLWLGRWPEQWYGRRPVRRAWAEARVETWAEA